MAGDHKCPVCNSTFTRPQHVARHMRSHTGDRPYKCQHCGDQFARSDLLSRHVNKCHAAEKPPTTTAPNNRRKGTAAASRATTSKQACDQCVQSSLPCDGCNPCSKCVSRKCRCTYVKFHRQTAPAGPGHPPPNALAHQAHRESIVGGSGYPDDFMLASHAASSSLGGLYIPSADYALPPASSLYTAHGYPDSRDPNFMGMSRDAIDTSPEMMARYRAQAEMLGRAGMLPNGALAHPMGATQGAVMPGMYAADHQQLGRYDMSSSQANAWAHPTHDPSFQNDGHGKPVDLDGFAPGPHQPFSGGGGSAALSAHPPTNGAPFSTLPAAANQQGASAGGAYAGSGIPFPQHHMQHPDHAPGGRRASEELSDDFGSDSAHSVPSSANSSSVHLPLVDHRGRPYSASPTAPYQQSNLGMNGNNEVRKNDEVGEGGFSNAFGLLSLDAPAVMAGLANDSAPFFSELNDFSHEPGSEGTGAHSAGSSSTSLHSSTTSQSRDSSNTSHSSHMGGLSLQTPTPELLSSLKGNLLSAGGRDALDSKELRDFWKQYMRTPGSQAQTPMFSLQTPTGPGQQLGTGGRPSPTRRHSRVASLPSIKTPPLAGYGANQEFGTFAANANGDFTMNPGLRMRARQAQGEERRKEEERQAYTHGYSSVRTTLHGDAEDLKSYEQAVLARKAPTQLKLVPRRRGTMPAGSMAPLLGKNGALQPPPVPSLSHSTNMGFSANAHMNGGGSPGHANHNTSNKMEEMINGREQRSGSSSLADAFGSPLPGYAHQASSQSPRESSVGAESSDGGGGGGGTTSFRPSFKRLASQTLGPANAKRALLGPAGWDDEDALEEDDDEVEEGHGQHGHGHGHRDGQGHGQGHGHSGGVRRFSLPASAGGMGMGIARGGSTLPPIRTHAVQSQSPPSAYPG